MTVLRLVPALLLAGAVAGSAAAQPGPPVRRGQSTELRHCVDTTFVSNWEPINDHTVLVWAGSHPYRMETSRCSALAGPLPRITAILRGGSQVCSPHDLQLRVSAGDIPGVCFVQSIQEIDPGQARALEKAGR